MWKQQDWPPRSPAGYTLLELLAIVVIVGVLAAIAAPAWHRYRVNREVAAARDEVRLGILQAQNSAIAHRASWRFSIREVNGRLEWATHPDSVSWQDTAGWESLSPNVVLYEADTTLIKSGGIYYAKFGFQGEVEGRLGTITLDSQNGIARNQCVVISTLIGATRKGEEQPLPRGDRYCY